MTLEDAFRILGALGVIVAALAPLFARRRRDRAESSGGAAAFRQRGALPARRAMPAARPAPLPAGARAAAPAARGVAAPPPRPAPSHQAAAVAPRAARFAHLLRHRDTLRASVVLSEILRPPLAFRRLEDR